MKIPFISIPFAILLSCQPKSDDPGNSAHGNAEPGRPESVTRRENPDTFDFTRPQSLIGQEVEEVRADAEKQGIRSRILEMDGKSFPATMDMRPDRLNFRVRDGRIIEVTNG